MFLFPCPLRLYTWSLSPMYLLTASLLPWEDSLPSSIWSDHGTNFVGTNCVLKELNAFLLSKQTEETASQRPPKWGALSRVKCHLIPWLEQKVETAVKNFNRDLFQVVGTTKLNHEEMSTVLIQIAACLNSGPLGTIPHNDDSIEMLIFWSADHYKQFPTTPNLIIRCQFLRNGIYLMHSCDISRNVGIVNT